MAQMGSNGCWIPDRPLLVWATWLWLCFPLLPLLLFLSFSFSLFFFFQGHSESFFSGKESKTLLLIFEDSHTTQEMERFEGRRKFTKVFPAPTQSQPDQGDLKDSAAGELPSDETKYGRGKPVSSQVRFHPALPAFLRNRH